MPTSYEEANITLQPERGVGIDFLLSLTALALVSLAAAAVPAAALPLSSAMPPLLSAAAPTLSFFFVK